MKIATEKQVTIASLKKQILKWEGLGRQKLLHGQMGMGAIESAFPTGLFPLGAVHELVYHNQEELAACCGFLSGILSFLIKQDGVCLWINNSKQVFAPAIGNFGISPDRIVFVHMKKERDILWAMEEGLKCDALRVVIAEVGNLDFVQSRRLQLAVEKSGVTGFVIRSGMRGQGATMCVAKWRIRPVPSFIVDDLPGVGLPQWEVQLLKVRNGNPSRWLLYWRHNQFIARKQERSTIVPAKKMQQKTG